MFRLAGVMRPLFIMLKKTAEPATRLLAQEHLYNLIFGTHIGAPFDKTPQRVKQNSLPANMVAIIFSLRRSTWHKIRHFNILRKKSINNGINSYPLQQCSHRRTDNVILFLLKIVTV